MVQHHHHEDHDNGITPISFPVVFWNANGAVWIIVITTLVSFGSGSVLGLRLFVSGDDDSKACDLGAHDAEAAAAMANFIACGITMVGNPMLGAYSDGHGRRRILLLSLFLSCIPAIAFVLLVQVATMSPIWYYASTTVLGVVNYPSISFAALSDIIPKHHRTASYGVFMAAFFGGFSIAPTLAVVWTDPVVLSSLSLFMIVLAFLLACLVLPETMVVMEAGDPPQLSRIIPVVIHNDSMSITTDLNMGVDDDNDDDEADEDGNDAIDDAMTESGLEDWSWWDSSMCTIRVVVHCIQNNALEYWSRLSILRSNRTLLLLTLASFLSAMVFSTDATLFIYYVENNFSVGPKDIAGLCLALGIAGVVIQGGLLSIMLRIFGERKLLVLSFVSGTFHNILYWTARSKGALYLAMVASQLTKTNYPILSSLAGKQVAESEQGQLQGVLSAINALAMAVGPPIFLKLSSTPSQVFAYASFVYGLGAAAVAYVAVSDPSPADSHMVDDEQLPDDDQSDRAYFPSLEEPLLHLGAELGSAETIPDSS